MALSKSSPPKKVSPFVDFTCTETHAVTEGILGTSCHLKHALLYFQNRDVESATSKIIHRNSMTGQRSMFSGHYYTTKLHHAHILPSSDLFKPYARAAAVGSLITLSTFRPAICPASLVAWRNRENMCRHRIRKFLRVIFSWIKRLVSLINYGMANRENITPQKFSKRQYSKSAVPYLPL